MPLPTMKPLLTLAEAVEYSHIPEANLEALVRTEEISAIGFDPPDPNAPAEVSGVLASALVLIKRSSLEKWIEHA